MNKQFKDYLAERGKFFSSHYEWYSHLKEWPPFGIRVSIWDCLMNRPVSKLCPKQVVNTLWEEVSVVKYLFKLIITVFLLQQGGTLKTGSPLWRKRQRPPAPLCKGWEELVRTFFISHLNLRLSSEEQCCQELVCICDRALFSGFAHCVAVIICTLSNEITLVFLSQVRLLLRTKCKKCKSHLFCAVGKMEPHLLNILNYRPCIWKDDVNLKLKVETPIW